ncbi:translation initiation factor eif-2b epsilon [Chrysochromulina tobinii]|uniref:Translation initiation factor eIF2B subunit epsilon n=1 Tax=Chrysochromulina tobinii TaxID=1460289 RepID=A0A0M0K7D1_9EUKA|nr:translation initiation factor eif-2b epsilon [Chrysochromulina tobinii]|eukprot:KOO34714.1 translation initiation factor eif-2b epsilon [Chrysochromulina sp. CCMP291]
MAPKGGKKDDDLAQQEVLQAVVLADSFASHFRPMTFQMPKVLMPLGSVPMIEYTLEFLAAGGVQEIYIFCCAHADEVERYIVESDMERRLATVSLHVLKSQGECMSAGDALREVEARGVIKSDFVLVPGDVIANLSLAPLIAAHKARREVDRDAVLTTVMARVPASHRARRGGEEKLVALSGETGRLLMYDEAVKEGWATKVRLPMALLQETDRFELHRDLYDTHIDVCTPELLVLLQDNFDWQDLRRDLLPGVLGQFEMLGKTIYTHVLSTEYAARVHDPHTYDVVSRDLLQRWAFPLVPDANLLPGCSYRCTAHCVYQEAGVSLARSAAIVRDSAIGEGTTIGERTVVEGSVVGRDCVVGVGVTLSGCYLWGGVIVEDGATLTGCICGEGVRIGLLAKCSAGTGLTLLGPGGHGRLWKVVPTAASLGFDRPVAQGQCDDELSEEEDEELEETNLEDVENEQFATAVRELIRDALRSADKDDAVENLALELNGLKFGADRTFADSVRAIVPPLLAEAASAPTKKAKVANLKRALEKWAPLLKKFVQSKADQRALVEGVAAACEQANEGLLEVFDHALKLLYDREDDLLDEQAILKWAAAVEEEAEEGSLEERLLQQADGLLKWLRESDDEEEDDDDE